jgi:hypothetical protein
LDAVPADGYQRVFDDLLPESVETSLELGEWELVVLSEPIDLPLNIGDFLD